MWTDAIGRVAYHTYARACSLTGHVVTLRVGGIVPTDSKAT